MPQPYEEREDEMDDPEREEFEAQQHAERIEAEHGQMRYLLAKMVGSFVVAHDQLSFYGPDRGYSAAFGAATAFEHDAKELLEEVNAGDGAARWSSRRLAAARAQVAEVRR